MSDKNEQPVSLTKQQIDAMLRDLIQNGKTFVTPPSGWGQQWFTIPKTEEVSDQEALDFMLECRERTAYMEDDKKCEYCKLRFRCYTELRVEEKRKTRMRRQKSVISNTKRNIKKKV